MQGAAGGITVFVKVIRVKLTERLEAFFAHGYVLLGAN